MSIDYTILCDKCGEYLHFGQHSGSVGFNLGYSSLDGIGEKLAKKFIEKHGYHNREIGLRIILTDSIPSDYRNVEKYLSED